MKFVITVNILVVLLFGETLQPVTYVNPQKFSGLWYEIARTHNTYQERCVASSVEYKLVDSLEYEVFNRCFEDKIGGELIEYTGSAEPTKGTNMSSITMTYYWIFSKKYNVYYLQSNYDYAVVADQEFEQVWIMSRRPTMPKEKLSEIVTYLSQGFDIKRLIYTPQDVDGRYR
ncbi:MAG: lipocalin family protein [Campylobacterales bacterium]|nr:lipocalin family protein [Campylobacterales bacterium]